MSHSNLYDDDDILIQCGFFEFKTGAPHPLSSKHIVSLPMPDELYHGDVCIEVLGEHILVLAYCIGCEYVFYIVSWKTGTTTLVSGFSKSLSHPRLR
jgi:hypothetical protein